MPAGYGLVHALLALLLAWVGLWAGSPRSPGGPPGEGPPGGDPPRERPPGGPPGEGPSGEGPPGEGSPGEGPPGRWRPLWTALALCVGLGASLSLRLWPERVANALPHPDLVYFSDLTPHCALALALLATRSGAQRAERLRRALLGSLLVGVALYASEVPFLARSLDLGPGRVDRRAPAYPVVRQSTPSTCAAAAAATLLRASGRAPRADERALAAACLTDPRRGTHPLGLWRGLSVASGAPARYTFPSLDELRQRAPCLLRVGLSDRIRDPELYRVLRDECGWPEGQSHAVVLFGFAPGGPGEDVEVALIGDPRLGFERWGLTHFRALWHGVALELGDRTR